MSNGPPLARPDDAGDAQWLFPQERAPSPPRNEGCKHNGFVDPALLLSNGPHPTPNPPFSFNVDTKTMMDELQELVTAYAADTVAANATEIDASAKAMDELHALVAATNAATVKEIAATVAAILKDNDAHVKAQRELFAAANAMTTSLPVAANAMAISPPTTANATANTTMAELRELVTATQVLTAANATEIDAYAKANRELFAANAMATSHPIAANAMATSHPITANVTAFSHPTAAVSKETNISPFPGTRDGHDHATGGIVPVVNSPGPSGVASMAVLSLPACDITSRPGIAPRVQISSSPTTRKSSPTADGLRRSAPTITLIWRLSWQISGRSQTIPTNASRRRTHLLHRSMMMMTMTRMRPSTLSG